MIFLASFDPPRFDGRHACDGLALVAHDGTGSEAPVNCRWIVSVLGCEIEIDGRRQCDAHGVSSFALRLLKKEDVLMVAKWQEHTKK
jgi:hypothetical protein